MLCGVRFSQLEYVLKLFLHSHSKVIITCFCTKVGLNPMIVLVLDAPFITLVWKLRSVLLRSEMSFGALDPMLLEFRSLISREQK